MSSYDEQHLAQRELLGSFALGHLPSDEALALQAHLDGCPACRLELADLASIVPALRSIDQRSLAVTPTPPADLGAAILIAVSSERLVRDRAAQAARRRRRFSSAVTAAAAGVAVLASGLAIGRTTAPATVVSARPTASSSASPIPMEPVDLTAAVPGISVASAIVIPHGWGVEARFVATGLELGTTYKAWFLSRSGKRLAAGEFLGVGAKTLKCNMQAALLRSQTAGFVVTDPSGRTVLSAALPG